MTAILIDLLNRAAEAAPVFVIGVSAVTVAIAPRLRVLHFPGLVVAKRKAGTR
jgi:hypothetical protein